MVDQLHLSQCASTLAFDKVQGPSFESGPSQTKTSFVRYDEMMPTPELLGDDTSSLQTIDSPRSFIALDIPYEDERQAKRPRIDSLLSPVSNTADELAFEEPSTSPENYGPSFIGIHHVWTTEEEKTINRSYDYIISHSGKDIRKQVLAAFNVWLDIDPTSLDIINRVVGMLHNASLLIDDIQDSSILRRGAPSAHIVFGTAQTINSANYVYFQAMQELYKLGPQSGAALQIYCEEMLNLHRGQGMDLYWRDTLTLPTEEAYMKMIANKTGGLFRLAVRLMGAVSACTFDFMPLVEKIGLIFQIRDDYKNLVSNEYNKAKGYCEDLTEGKFSFPIIHAIQQSPPGDTQLLNILAQKTKDVQLKDFVVNYMRNVTKTFEYTESVLERLNHEAMAEIAVFGVPNPLLNFLLEKLAA